MNSVVLVKKWIGFFFFCSVSGLYEKKKKKELKKTRLIE